MFLFGSRDKRFDPKDVKEFVETQKSLTQNDLIIQPVKRKARSRTANIDFQKRKINLELNRVV